MTVPEQYVTWPQLLEWAKAHGAINDKITSIQISTTFLKDEIRGVVSISGTALNEEGKPYLDNGTHNVAGWQVTNQMLRWLPFRISAMPPDPGDRSIGN